MLLTALSSGSGPPGLDDAWVSVVEPELSQRLEVPTHPHHSSFYKKPKR